MEIYLQTYLMSNLVSFFDLRGGRVYLVGGCVRDLFHKQGVSSYNMYYLSPKDFKDIDLLVTGLSQEEVLEVLSRHNIKHDAVGKSFGVIKAWYEGIEIDIALPRTEKSIGEKHTDFEVIVDHNLAIEDDLLRRDFTINAIAIDLITKEVIDPFGGLEDLQRGVIKTLTPQSFKDDPLRMLRGIQFAARFKFEMSYDTLAQIHENKYKVRSISPERITTELTKGLANPQVMYHLLHMTGLDIILFETPYLNLENNRFLLQNTKTLMEFLLSFPFVDLSLLRLTRDQIKERDALLLLKHAEKTDQSPQTVYRAIKIYPKVVETRVFEKLLPVLRNFELKVYPNNLSDLVLRGTDLTDLGFKNKEIGIVLNNLIDDVIAGKVENKKSHLINHIKENYKNG